MKEGMWKIDWVLGTRIGGGGRHDTKIERMCKRKTRRWGEDDWNKEEREPERGKLFIRRRQKEGEER